MQKKHFLVNHFSCKKFHPDPDFSGLQYFLNIIYIEYLVFIINLSELKIEKKIVTEEILTKQFIVQ